MSEYPSLHQASHSLVLQRTARLGVVTTSLQCLAYIIRRVDVWDEAVWTEVAAVEVDEATNPRGDLVNTSSAVTKLKSLLPTFFPGLLAKLVCEL